MDSDKFDSLLDLEDFSDIYASIYGDTDKDNTEATEQQPKTEYNNAATADKTASGADELFSHPMLRITLLRSPLLKKRSLPSRRQQKRSALIRDSI